MSDERPPPVISNIVREMYEWIRYPGPHSPSPQTRVRHWAEDLERYLEEGEHLKWERLSALESASHAHGTMSPHARIAAMPTHEQVRVMINAVTEMKTVFDLLLEPENVGGLPERMASMENHAKEYARVQEIDARAAGDTRKELMKLKKSVAKLHQDNYFIEDRLHVVENQDYAGLRSRVNELWGNFNTSMKAMENIREIVEEASGTEFARNADDDRIGEAMNALQVLGDRIEEYYPIRGEND